MGKQLVDRSVLEGESIILFRGAVKSKWTLDPYERRLVQFLSAQKKTCDEFVAIAKKEPAVAERMIVAWTLEQKKRAENKEISNATVSNSLKPLKLLLEMNDASLNWKKLKRLLPRARRFALDRIPSLEELAKILEHSDFRGKALTLVLCSSGIREGAVEHLKVRNLTEIKIESLTCGKLVVYEGDGEQYLTFISPEAYDSVQRYLDWRKEHGEKITNESPLFRDKFDPLISAYRTYGGGKPETPKPMNGASIRAYYNRLFYDCGIRTEGRRRHEFSVHSFRKWFKTKCENAGMKPIITEILMGHTTGISDSYYRPTEKELAEDYAKAIDSLTIDPSVKLNRELSILREQLRDSPRLDAIQQALDSKEQEIETLRKESRATKEELQKLFNLMYKRHMEERMLQVPETELKNDSD